MAILRLTQDTIGEGEYLIRARFERAGQGALGGKARLEFGLGAQDREALRWYLEDYLEHPFDPSPQIAAGVEGRMEEIGRALFGAIFEANERMRQVWRSAQGLLSETRVEIHTEVAEATAIPWELLYAPPLADYVALRTAAFVRSYEEGRQAPRLPNPSTSSGHGIGEAIRILLAICRPKGKDDVPFRSVASRLVKGLNAEASQQVQLDVLRPPTFEQLGKVLGAAQRAGKPYHVLHFDGHGTYLELNDPHQQGEALLDAMSGDTFKAPRSGKHGYLLFEDPKDKQNMKLVDGRALGQLLVRCHVPVLVLNACRSAHAESPDEENETPRPDVPSVEVSPDQESQQKDALDKENKENKENKESGRTDGAPDKETARTDAPPTKETTQGEVKSSAKKGLLSRVGGFWRRWVAGSTGEAQKMSHDAPFGSTFSASEQLVSGEGERFDALFSGQQVYGQGDRTAERAYGSLAQEVMEQGVAGVVAMRYNLYVVTATRLVAEVYEALVQGNSLGAAVTHGRQQLALSPLRNAIYGPIALQDWSVPVVYEAAPINLFPPPEGNPNPGREARPSFPSLLPNLEAQVVPCGRFTFRRRAPPPKPTLSCPLRLMRASLGAMRRCWRWIVLLMSSRLSCFMPTRAAAKRPLRPSLRAGINKQVALKGLCSSPALSNTCPWCAS
ncbi:MAG: CHAT domain-containing protein [Ardenticatenaceae bacterium]